MHSRDNDGYAGDDDRLGELSRGQENPHWRDWVDYWEAHMPQPDPDSSGADGEDEDSSDTAKPPRRGRLGAGGWVAVCLGVVAVGGVLAFLLNFVLFSPPQQQNTSGVAGTASGASAAQVPTVNSGGSPTGGPEANQSPQCVESSKDGKLVTGNGGPVTSPEMLVAEFQHRFFDLRDGAKVSELWKGYTPAAMQASIDQALGQVQGHVSWCLTVMPAEPGWWNTQVNWWADGDTKVRETWDGTYKIDRMGNTWQFTGQRDTAAKQ